MKHPQMALIDTDVRRTFATGIAGFSHVVDSLSAIKYAKVKTIRDENGLVVDFETTGDFRNTEMMMTAQMISQYGFFQTFMKKLKSITPTVNLNRQLLSLPLPQTLYMESYRCSSGRKKSRRTAFTWSKPELRCRTERTSCFPELRCQAACLMNGHLTESLTPRPSTRMQSDIIRRSALTTW